jgi:hypothetical protein
MREFVFEVSITAIVRVRAETQLCQAPRRRRMVVEYPLTASPAIDSRSKGVLTRTGSVTICRVNFGTFTCCFRTFTSRSDFSYIH